MQGQTLHFAPGPIRRALLHNIPNGSRIARFSFTIYIGKWPWIFLLYLYNRIITSSCDVILIESYWGVLLIQSPHPMHTLCQCSQCSKRSQYDFKGVSFVWRNRRDHRAQGLSTWPQPEAAQESIRSKGILQLIPCWATYLARSVLVSLRELRLKGQRSFCK